ncbi:aminodeoxychorismate/anthranilate synthase component II [Aquibacillus halophilus]|uniref:Aminodeoxychorismate/anthranilate synthase component II n=1 Tax=Aquibacillus halophilus TaxID=930132 RepID=A0A6A8DLH1_9BACI|nr:aminodeoxychorismate/anthranilate synthase component II [Aquibacillus halophilus]MRH42102.1 aminodeoxychorismate/anthranilate synthase component II [Aquibacillus halophilus]
MIIIIDNYDSFTYNLVQYYKKLDSSVLVYKNDQITIDQVDQLDPDLIVFSPGPGTPNNTGNCREILKEFYNRIPIIGVCLGFQLIVDFFGGKIIKGTKPMHGKVSFIHHTSRGVFDKIASPTKVTRYHSLVAEPKNLPIDLEVTSYAEDGVIMGVRHLHFPVEGIQFHPESVLTESGFAMIENSYAQALLWRKRIKGGMKNESLSSV